MSSQPSVAVRNLGADDLAWAEDASAGIGGRHQARRGELIDLLGFPGLVAEAAGQPIGLLLYRPDDGTGAAELAGLVTPVRGAGAGTALVEALVARIPDRPIWVVTTNDNTDALRFYQRLGFRLRALRPGAVDEARRTLKPSIPSIGAGGVPIRDELELVREPSDHP